MLVTKLLFPLAALGLLSLIWGYNWVVMKEALRDCPPLLFAAMRVLGGAVVLLPLLRILGRSTALPPLGYVIPLGILQSTGFVGLTLWALEFAGAGKTAVLVYMMPLWLLLFAWPLLGDRIHGLQWPAMGVAFLGLLFILDPQHAHGAYRGSALAILSGVFWAASAIWQKKRSPEGLDILATTTWQMVFGGLVLASIAVIVDPIRIHWTIGLTEALLYNAILGNALAWFLWTYALHHLPSGVAGMGTLLAPLVGVLASWVQLGERPGFREFTGMGLIFLSLVLVTWQHLRPREEMPIPSPQE